MAVLTETDLASRHGKHELTGAYCAQAASVHTDAYLASVASISLSSFGSLWWPFGDRSQQDGRNERHDQDGADSRREEHRELKDNNSTQGHEASDDWLANGKCPIARTYRALSGTLPLISSFLRPPAGVRYVCPPAIVAARAALAKHPAMQTIRHQELVIRVAAIGTMGMLLNMPLGAWREHYEKFSPQWILVVHSSVPVVAMLRKAALIPKYAIAFTIAMCILGQAVGSRVHRRVEKKKQATADARSAIAALIGPADVSCGLSAATA